MNSLSVESSSSVIRAFSILSGISASAVGLESVCKYFLLEIVREYFLYSSGHSIVHL